MSEENKRTPAIKILQLLKAIVAEPRAATAAHLSQSLSIPLATVYRQLEALTEEGYICPTATGSYSPGRAFRAMILDSFSSEPQITYRRALLKKLSEDLDETVSLSIPTGEYLVYFDRYESHWPIQKSNVKTGDKLPMTTSASGKLYLSQMDPARVKQIFSTIKPASITKNSITKINDFLNELETIRTDGQAFDREEWIEGMIGAAVPIFNRDNKLCACLSTHSLTTRKQLEDLENKIPILKSAARRFEQMFAGD